MGVDIETIQAGNPAEGNPRSVEKSCNLADEYTICSTKHCTRDKHELIRSSF